MHTFYEFFAGGGMARAGLGNEWKCLFANDLDEKKANSYAANWGTDVLKVEDGRLHNPVHYCSGVRYDTRLSGEPASGKRCDRCAVECESGGLFVSKPLNANTVTGAMHVSQAGQLVTGTVTVMGNGQTLEFTPSSAWQYGALIEVFLDTTATDLSGNTVNAYRGTFTTVSDPASTTPVMVSFSPLVGATGVPLNAGVDALYSGPLNPSTVNATNVILKGTNNIPSTVTLDPTGTIIHLKPNASLAASTQYCFFTGNLTGINGGAVSGQYYGSCFTTGANAATAAPDVVTVSPADKLGNVPLNANITVVFSGPIDPVSVSGATIQVSGGGMTSVPASISFTNSNQVVQITPEAPLPASTAMTLTISGVTDIAGNSIVTHTTHFTTGTAAAPGVIVSNPVSGATGVPLNDAISLQANAEIDGPTVNNVTFPINDNTLGALNNILPGTYSLSSDGMTMYFLPSTPLAAGHNFSVYFDRRGVIDLAGNMLTSDCSSGACLNNYSFTTGSAASASAPQVIGVSPANGLSQVPINAQIVVAFNEPVNGETLGQVRLSANGSSLQVTSTLSNGSQTLTLVPLTGLAANTAYALTLTGVTDLSGNVMSSQVNSSFTTNAQADLRTPTVVTVTPASKATGILRDTTIQIQFNKLMNVLSFTGQSVQLLSGTATVPAVLTFDPSGTLVTITPSSSLASSTAYTVKLTSAISDLEGGALSAFSSSFTTGTN